MRLNVGGTYFIVGRQTLTSVKDSLLTAQINANSNGNQVFLDRDSEVFTHVITYLRSGRKLIAKEINDDMR